MGSKFVQIPENGRWPTDIETLRTNRKIIGINYKDSTNWCYYKADTYCIR